MATGTWQPDHERPRTIGTEQDNKKLGYHDGQGSQDMETRTRKLEQDRTGLSSVPLFFPSSILTTVIGQFYMIIPKR